MVYLLSIKNDNEICIVGIVVVVVNIFFLNFILNCIFWKLMGKFYEVLVFFRLF